MKADATLGIIAIVPDDWTGIVTVRHQVLQRLAKYYPIVWVESAQNWREFAKPSGPRFLAGDRWTEPCPSMEVLTPGLRHPAFHRPAWLAAASLRSRLAAARKRLRARGVERIALYLWRDEFAPALDLVEHDFSCYHIDDEYTFSDEDQPITPREMALLRRVDQVIIHSPALFEKKGRVNPRSALIPNGVDYPLFSTPHAEPADIAPIAHPRIGYAGVLKKQLDFDLLIRLAEARPQWSFVVVGPIMNVDGKQAQVAALHKMTNVHFLGGKPASELPAYIQRFDVCLMLYDITDYTRYIYPLKLNEYLATGRPAVSSPIDAARSFTHVMTIAGSDAEWLAAIERGLAESGPEAAVAAEARKAVAKASDWDTLVSQIAHLFAASRTQAASGRPQLVQAS